MYQSYMCKYTYPSGAQERFCHGYRPIKLAKSTSEQWATKGLPLARSFLGMILQYKILSDRFLSPWFHCVCSSLGQGRASQMESQLHSHGMVTTAWILNWVSVSARGWCFQTEGTVCEFPVPVLRLVGQMAKVSVS